MAINSKNKGKNGELEWVKFLKENFGIEARRSQQFKGTADSADVDSDWNFVHWEVKRVENLNIDKAMEKAILESGNRCPVIAHRKNGKDWMVTMRAADLLKIAKGIANE